MDNNTNGFYAINEVAPNEILIFNSEAERDDWVHYQDEFSANHAPKAAGARSYSRTVTVK